MTMMILEGEAIPRDANGNALLRPGDMVELFRVSEPKNSYMIDRDCGGWMNASVWLSSNLVIVLDRPRDLMMHVIPCSSTGYRSQRSYPMAMCLGTTADGLNPTLGYVHINRAWIIRVFRP